MIRKEIHKLRRLMVFAACALVSMLMPCHGWSANHAETLLKGKVIGTMYGYDYTTGQSSSSVNTKENAFDGNPATFFASSGQSMTWTGLDLGTPHVITRMGLTPRLTNEGPEKALLGVFEGANEPDFMDAVPLYLISQTPSSGRMTYYTCNVSRGFRYVRYVGPSSARCQVAELEFYGHEGEGDDSQFYQVTGIPTLSVHVQNGILPQTRGEDFDSRSQLIYDGGTKIQDYPILFRVRGNYSSSPENKAYRIKFNDGKSHHMMKGGVNESPVKAKKWVLINSLRDKTLMRNPVAWEVSRRVGLDWTPWYQVVDLLVNGEYRGTYTLADHVDVHEGRIDVTEMTADDVTEETITGGYYVEVDNNAQREPYWFTSSHGNPITVHDPDDDVIQPAQFNYIRNAWNDMEKAVYSSSSDEETGFGRVLDIESFLRFFLASEYNGNTDMLCQVYFYKERGDDHFYTGPVWDHELALDDDSGTYPANEREDWTYTHRCTGNFTDFVRHVISDGNVMSRLQVMWAELRDAKAFTTEEIGACVDSLRAQISESARLNFIRWPYLNQYISLTPAIRGSWDKEVDVVRDFVQGRIAWMDRKLRYNTLDVVKGIYQITSPHDLTTFVRFVNQKYELDAKAALTADVDMSKYSEHFQPIGSSLRPFRGEFDGQSHTIRNLTVEGNREVGIFGVVADGARISNLNIDSSCSFSGRDYIGSVIGSVRKGSATLEGCTNEAPVTATGDQAGGLVGRARTATLDIINSYNAGPVTAATEAAAMVGASAGAVTVANSYNVGQITGSTPGIEFAASSAGVTLENCYDLYGSQAKSVTPEQVADGALCYLLNGEGRNSLWRQNIDNGRSRDYHPVLQKNHGQVFKTADGYTNVNPNARGYRYYMIDITDIQGSGIFQFAEFNLLDNGMEEVTDVVAYKGTESSISNENWPFAADYNVYTKYCGGFNGRIWLMLDAGQEIAVTGYRIYTANDTNNYPGRNPSSWRVCGTNTYTENPDDASWELIDERLDDYTLGATSYTPYDFMLDNTVEQFAINPARIVLNEGEKYQLGIVTKPSTIVVNDGEWKSSNTNVAIVDTDGLVTAVGLGTATISVTSLSMGGLTAECQVRVTDEVIGFRYYVLQVEEVGDAGVIQLSEVALLDSNGEEADGLKIYSGPDEFFSNESWRNLCDKKTGTKYCGNFQNGQGVCLYFDAGKRIKPQGYRLYTANDTQNIPGRNPRTWRLWGSDVRTLAPDADAWVLLDERVQDYTLGATNFTPYDFSIDWASVVGLEQLAAPSRLPDVVYDLQGRRVARPTRGLYIINGRKVLVR
ncbi:MAG: CotH kinase family protein [Bacteroidaceae bacterium]|nr:CotH kinase family protein [Bacteroidaceae bacterium]